MHHKNVCYFHNYLVREQGSNYMLKTQTITTRIDGKTITTKSANQFSWKVCRASTQLTRLESFSSKLVSVESLPATVKRNASSALHKHRKHTYNVRRGYQYWQSGCSQMTPAPQVYGNSPSGKMHPVTQRYDTSRTKNTRLIINQPVNCG